MNPYFLFFSIYAVLISPLTLRFRLRLGKRPGYRVKVQMIGLPFARKRKPNDNQDEEPIREKDVAQTLLSLNPALVKAAFSKRVWKRIFAGIQLRQLSFFARISFQDAYQTALCYSGLYTLFQSLTVARVLPAAFSWHTEVDFQAAGTELLLQGIVAVRLGNLFPAALTFARAYHDARTKKTNAQPKEDAYAAASH